MTDASSTSTSPSSFPALDLSRQLAAAVKAAGSAVVGVEARRRRASSGILWQAAASPATVAVTADHAVEREEDITVILADGRRVPAVLAGRDPSTDIAALRVEDAE